ncbi:uncharacterized protein LOC5514106 isoform X1 [Nematostella vectensis]|uniref:uncharacterized protein LOC5514106 isoform X1 n=1 Tax=Nematostella vectensis TaxID=45351 RepID=UPI0020770764|nr:uncharacterized protein LOC5514106 isoform X1 [Nematostella vectensis]
MESTELKMAEIEERKYSEDGEGSAVESGKPENAVDLSCIHWGYLNCVLVVDPSRKAKDLQWKTYWVDLCGSTLRFYRDLSLPPDTADYPPPTSVAGPTKNNDKKEAFLMLKKGASVEITGYEEYKAKKRIKKGETSRARNNLFKLLVTKTPGSPVYYFQAPSKGSMYRWISKIEEGIDLADTPQSNSTVDKRLQDAKMLAVEQRRYHLAPELKYSEKDDEDSGMEGDVEESFEIVEKPPEPAINPRLVKLQHKLRAKECELEMLEGQEQAFLGSNTRCELSKVCEFEATTKDDYYLVLGHPSTLIPKKTKLKILGQLSNRRWRCFVDLPKASDIAIVDDTGSGPQEMVSRREVTTESGPEEMVSRREVTTESGPKEMVSRREVTTESGPEKMVSRREVTTESGPEEMVSRREVTTESGPEEMVSRREVTTESGPEKMVSRREVTTERLIGSVPTSLLVELEDLSKKKRTLKVETGTPMSTPGVSPHPSPPLSPYSPHRPSDQTNQRDASQGEQVVEDLRRFTGRIAPPDQDAWEQFYLPSPPSSPDTSRSTSPSLSPSQSLEALDSQESQKDDRHSLESDEVPVTYIGAESGEEPPDEDLEPENEYREVTAGRDVIVAAAKLDSSTDDLADSPESSCKNYGFVVTKKLRQRGISLIVGSSSSEDEDDDGVDTIAKITRRKLDEEFERFSYPKENTQSGVRPYSAFVPRKKACISFGISAKTTNLRLATTDELLKDYASPFQQTPLSRSKTFDTFNALREFSTPENSPPLNRRRTIQMTRNNEGGFGFTLQTYGIVQQNGEVEFMTFVLAVEEDGPAYMAGMRPGDIIVSVENRDVEEEDHRVLVSLLQEAPVSIRLVVVFVDAIRRMHLNTRIKVLKTELQSKEDEFEALCRKEQEICRGLSHCISIADIQPMRQTHPRQNPYMYTTELTSSFAKDSPNVRDSLVQYRQQPQQRTRPASLPDQSELSKQGLACTTGTEMLETFASSPEFAKKSASLKLQKKVKKARQTSTTFKTYVELENYDNTPLVDEIGSTLSVSSSNSESSNRLSWPVSPDDVMTASPKRQAKSKKKNDKSPSKNNNQTNRNQGNTGITENTKSPKKTNIDATVPSDSSVSVVRVSLHSESRTSSVTRNTLNGSGVNVSVGTPRTSSTTPENTAIQPGIVSRLAKASPQSARTTPISARSESLKDLSTRGEVARVVWPPRDECKASERSDPLCSTEPRYNAKLAEDSSQARDEFQGKERSESNISQLKRLFEGSETQEPMGEQQMAEEIIHPSRVETKSSRPRLGSRPESFMLAMDAAEDWQLIPEKNRKHRNPHESTA